MRNSPSSCSATETHISWLFFTPDRAYKILKPVEMPFIDHSDPAIRRDSIRREYELNHEIAPDVYLGTADIEEDGELVDRMLVMRRLPDDRRLSALVGTDRFELCLRAVAHSVASLHARRDPIADAPMAKSTALAQNWQENFDAIRPHIGAVIKQAEFDRAEALAHAYLEKREGLLDSRISQGFVRDVHGDLTADDIYCLDDGPRILDCLAFNDRWRVIDVLSDIGFLVMDVHRLAGWQAAERLMRWYQEFSNEKHPASLAHHYVAYRAHVRAKIACFRVAQGDDASIERARGYHELACHHLERGRLRLILVGGGPGTGKSTLANELGDHFGCPVIASDEVRKDVTATPRMEHRFAAPGDGFYDAATTAAVYDEARREAELLLESGTSVLLDATWSRDTDRHAIRGVAERCGAELTEIECVLDPAIAKERIEHRMSDPDNLSDATPDLVDHLMHRRDAWPEAIEIATDGAVSDACASAVTAIS